MFEPFQSFAKRFGDRHVEAEVVEVHVDLEVLGNRLTEWGQLVFQIEPGSGLGFERGVALLGRLATFIDPIFDRHVDAPPTDEGSLADFVSQQRPDRCVHQLADRIETSHLQTGS